MRQWQAGIGCRTASTSPRSDPRRRTSLAASLAALAAVCAVSACDIAPDPDTGAVAMPPARTEIGDRLEDGPVLVAGAELDTALLRRFYARHGAEPVWANRPVQARSLVAAVLRAGDQGLEPARFHAELLRHRADLPPADRDLLLTDAALAYADALARGAVPVERRPDDQVLAPEPVDVVERVDAAIDAPDPGAAIEALAPHTPTYLGLRRALREVRAAAAAGHPAPARLQAIEVGLERQRWLPRRPPPDRVLVNVADERLVLFRAGRPVFSTRVVVGEDAKHLQTPEFRANIDASFFDPPWVIPQDIVTAEILPKIEHDPAYLAKNHMILLDGGEAEQLPGPDAGLGLIMFDMPNKFDVFLHDTPDRYIFSYSNRRLSHGCIRVQNPRILAALLLRQPPAIIDQGISTGHTTRHDLPAQVPVFVTYQTAFVDARGALQLRPDFYQRDATIWRELERPSRDRDAMAQADVSRGSFDF